ncbi:MAG: hypothetical protein IKF78_05125 [Atopobiaceae bacterium]|nr:hypothetical protein [Atopobiaceae bacterium]
MAGAQKEQDKASQTKRKKRRAKEGGSPKNAERSSSAEKQAKRSKKPSKRKSESAANKPSKRKSESAANKPSKRKGGTPKAKRPRKPLTAAMVVSRVLPVLALALAFAAIVVLYRRFMPQTVDAAPAQEIKSPSDEALAPNSKPNTYEGLEDKWLTSGRFTTGNAELDQQVKQYCDALTVEGSSARDNASKVYNNIVWSAYEDRGANEEPSGTEWATVAARHYFEGGSPADGVGGAGDVYDFAAVASYCLRYFGFTDALAVPIVKGNDSTGKMGSALVVVSDESGQECVCDPTLAAEGFMLDRSLYNITVDNIGQDLSPVEARGLKVEEPPQAVNSSSSSGNSASGGTSSNGAGGNDTNGSGVSSNDTSGSGVSSNDTNGSGVSSNDTSGSGASDDGTSSGGGASGSSVGVGTSSGGAGSGTSSSGTSGGTTVQEYGV